MVTVVCPNEGCNESFMKSQYDYHVQNCQHSRNTWSNGHWNRPDVSSNHSFIVKAKSTQKCHFAVLGCQFVGNDSELVKHMDEDVNSHLGCICKILSSNICGHSSHKPNGYAPISEGNMKQLLFTDFEEVEARVEKLSSEGGKTKSQATEIQEKQKEIAF